MKKTVLITGGAGFIGSHLTKKLLDNYYRVICIDNLSPYYKPAVKIKNISGFRKNPSYKFFKASILDIQKVRKIIDKESIDILVHLAAQPGTRLSFTKPLLYEQINIAGTYKVLEIAKEIKPEKLIFASSSSVYGNNKTPFDEEKTSTKPISVYGATKLAGEQACYAYHKNFHLPITILRFFSVYGPNGRPDMAPYLFTKALFNNKNINIFGDGSTARDWTYIEDIVNGIFKSIKKNLNFEIINLGNSYPLSLNKMISIIEKNTARKFKIRYLPRRVDEPISTYASINKARKLLNWTPKVKFEKGMQEFISWFKLSN